MLVHVPHVYDEHRQSLGQRRQASERALRVAQGNSQIGQICDRNYSETECSEFQ